MREGWEWGGGTEGARSGKFKRFKSGVALRRMRRGRDFLHLQGRWDVFFLKVSKVQTRPHDLAR